MNLQVYPTDSTSFENRATSVVK